jgi:ribosome maturation factor RimP
MIGEPSELGRRVCEIVEPVLAAMGFDLVRVRVTGSRRKTVQVMAERPGGDIDVDDCAEISEAVSAVLDVEDPIARDYILEVSSPGIDRPLVKREDFVRFLGHEAKIKLAEPIGGRKRFSGHLKGLSGDELELEVDEPGEGRRVVTLPLAQIADAQLVLTDELVRESLKGSRQRRS